MTEPQNQPHVVDPPPARAPSPEVAPSIPPWRRPRWLALFGTGLVVAAFVAWRVSTQPLEITTTLREVETRLGAKQKQTALKELKRVCEKRDCGCALAAAARALEVEATADAFRLLTSARSCKSADQLAGLRAEALVRGGKDADGRLAAERALAEAPGNPSAAYALALVSYRAGRFAEARELAARAKKNGRGPTADLLLGLAAYFAGDLERAGRAFRDVLATEPNDLEATYDLGLVAQKQGRYGEARSSYFKALRGDPKHLGARYNLAILAHSIGATAEANHHLARFAELAPDSVQLGELRAALAKPASNPPTHAFTLGRPATSASAPNVPAAPSATPPPLP